MINRRKALHLCAGGVGALAMRSIAPAYGQDGGRRWRVTGTGVVNTPALDTLLSEFMTRYHIRAGQIALARGSKLLVERGYTWADERFVDVQPATLFRLASVSKAFTAAVTHELVRSGKLTLATPAFSLLPYKQPRLPTQRVDPRIHDITIGHLIDNRGGWDIARMPGGDLSFDMRGVARRLGIRGALSRWDFVHYIYGESLQFTPGTEEHYSNIGWMVLGLVVEQVMRMELVAVIRQLISGPHELGPVHAARTLRHNRLPNEVIYDQPGTAPSQLIADREVPAPLAYGGELIYENCAASGGIVTNAATVARLIGRYAVWGIGGRTPNSARSGSMGGTSSFAASLGNGLDYCFIFNTRNFGDADDPVGSLAKRIEGVIGG